MEIIRSTTYDKMFAELSRREQGMVDMTLDLFKQDPYDAHLKNHTLRKPLAWLRSIWIDHDIRIIFKETWNHSKVVLLRVGTHTKTYGV